MTGTSIDGLDCALVEVSGVGLAMTARFLKLVSRPLGDLAAPTRALADQRPMTAGQIATLARDLALLHVDALKELAGDRRLDVVALHGQTVYHKPPVTWQLANPAVIAHGMRAPVVYDLRSADVATGGQGAPITPLADWILLRSPDEDRVVCNLGGFCNLTFLPRDHEAPQTDIGRIRGMDVCPCNHLLDRLAQALFGAPFDDGGRRAMTGTRHAAAGDDLLARIAAAIGDGPARRSLGTGDELDAWLEAWRGGAKPEDLAATACHVIATLIARERSPQPPQPARLLVAGGGSRNGALVNAIRSAWIGQVSSTDDLGLPAEAREAACMAVLGALCQDRVAITLPKVTGVTKAPISGAWITP
jgi:1,6-anhydro-N-acetylmuramate kinase